MVSFHQPLAAVIGPVATSTINAASRARITRRWPIAAIHISRPINPRTVAMAASVIDLGSNVFHGSHEFQEVTFSTIITPRVKPPTATVTATV